MPYEATTQMQLFPSEYSRWNANSLPSHLLQIKIRDLDMKIRELKSAVHLDKKGKQATGSFYTLEQIAMPIVKKLAKTVKRNKKLKKATRVLDPACGYGNLLAAMAVKYGIREQNLYGCDIDIKAIRECKRTFPKGHFYHCSALELENAVEFEFGAQLEIFPKIKKAKIKKKGEKKMLDMSQIDVIVGNPPYGAIGKKIFNKCLEQEKEMVMLFPTSITHRQEYSEQILTDIRKKLDTRLMDDTEILMANNASRDFGIHILEDVGIYHVSATQGESGKMERFENKLYKKLRALFPATIKDNNNTGDYPVYMREAAFVDRNAVPLTSKDNSLSSSTFPVYFKTANEANNFKKSLYTEFIAYCHLVASDTRHATPLPLMPNYKKAWTNEDYFDYFKLDKTEQKEILKFVRTFYWQGREASDLTPQSVCAKWLSNYPDVTIPPYPEDK